MRAFVSHAWEGKTKHPSFPRILLFLEEELGLELWKDNERLDAGEDRLSTALATAIGASDLFLLFWSQAARRSRHVAFEIEKATSAGKPLIVCRLDKTELDHELLQQKLFIDFSEEGSNRMVAERKLARAVCNLHEGAMDEATRNENRKLHELVGSLDDVIYTRDQVKDADDRRGYLLRALSKALALAKTSGDTADEEALRVIRTLVERYDQAAGDRYALNGVLLEARKLGASSNPMVALLSSKLCQEIERELADAGDAEPAVDMDKGALAASAGRYERNVAGEHARHLEEIRSALKGRVPPVHMEPVATLISNYIATSSSVLQWLVQQATLYGVAALGVVAQRLAEYYESPNDLIPDTIGILGRLDDAWLIHNTVAACAGAGLLDASAYPCDVQQLTAANDFAQRLLPAPMLRSLDSIREQILSELVSLMPGFGGTALEGFGGLGMGAAAGVTGPRQQSFEEMKDELAPSLGGMFLKYGV